MYLHIGNGKSVRKKNIIGIFDLDSATVSSITKKFIKKKEKEEMVDYLDKDLPRSFIVLEDNRVLLSRISTSGLKIRLEGDSDFYGE